jgi:hypothetical protein
VTLVSRTILIGRWSELWSLSRSTPQRMLLSTRFLVAQHRSIIFDVFNNHSTSTPLHEVHNDMQVFDRNSDTAVKSVFTARRKG